MEKETLKSLRAKAKELRSKVSAAPLSKATPDQLRSEIVMLERAVKAEEKALAKKAAKEASVPVAEAKEKKKTIPSAVPVKAVTAMKAPPKKIVSVDEREKELLKRERELAKKEKYMQMKMETEDTSDSEDY
jgi:hypothetical protein